MEMTSILSISNQAQLDPSLFHTFFTLKKWLWRPYKAPFLVAGCSCTEAFEGRSGALPRFLAPFLGLGGRLQLHGGSWRPKRGFAALLGTLLGPWWQAAAARSHLRPARAHVGIWRLAGRQVRSPLKNDFRGRARHLGGRLQLHGDVQKPSVFIRGFEGGRRPSNLGTMLAVCWAYVGLCWANVWPVLPAN